jgi:hypothetical protein
VVSQKRRYCRVCERETLHSRYHWEGLWAVQMFFVLSSACGVCLIAAVPLALLIGLIDHARPHHCDGCGWPRWRFPKPAGG